MLKVCVSINEGHRTGFGEGLVRVQEQPLSPQLTDDLLALHVKHPLIKHFGGLN